MKMSKAVCGSVVVAWILGSSVALAEDEKEGSSMFSVGASAEADKDGATADATATGDAEAPAEEPAPAEPEPATETHATTTTAVAADAPAGATDHSNVVGTFGIGYMGFRSLGASGLNGAALNAPVIGMRYWLDAGLGIDAGLGFSKYTGSTEIDPGGGGMSTDTDAPGPLVVILHAGLPLALADSQHFVFEVVPELNIGYASHKAEGAIGGGTDEDAFSALHFDVGARAGAEIHFGFIDIPQLALQAGVGLSLAFDSTTTEDDQGAVTATQDTSRTTVSTGVGDNPWNIFAANVAALYYFDD